MNRTDRAVLLLDPPSQARITLARLAVTQTPIGDRRVFLYTREVEVVS